MFAAHKAQININRSEPSDLNVKEAIRIVQMRNHEYCNEVVTRDLLKKRTKDPAKSRKKIIKNWERDERLDRCAKFVQLWNYWRSFYFHDRYYQKKWEPKSAAQLTVIEKIMKLTNETEMDLGLFIACSFKPYQYSQRFTPTVQMCLGNGEQSYYRHREEVMADIRQAEYLEDALV